MFRVKILNVSFIRILQLLVIFAKVAYVVDWTIELRVPDVGLKNEQTLIVFSASTLQILSFGVMFNFKENSIEYRYDDERQH